MSEIVKVQDEQLPALMEKFLSTGDLKAFSPAERVQYYSLTCQSVGLNPLTRPFDYIQLNGKLTLYAKKDATDQLRKINSVSIDDVTFDDNGDCYTVTVKGHDKTGRADVEIGVVPKKDMQGNSANARMKALTKAKRRLTLSLCGLGWLDETELETIPDVKLVNVNENGQIDGEQKTQPKQQTHQLTDPAQEEVFEAEIMKPRFDEQTFLKNYIPDSNIPMLTKDQRMEVKNSVGEKYIDLTTEKLFYMSNKIREQLGRAQNDSRRDDLNYKLSAIQSIFIARKEIQESFE